MLMLRPVREWIIPVIGAPQQVISGCAVIIGQLNQHLCGYVYVAAFVVAVYALGTVQDFCKLTLIQVGIFPQVPNSIISHQSWLQF